MPGRKSSSIFKGATKADLCVEFYWYHFHKSRATCLHSGPDSVHTLPLKMSEA